jgi:urease beta subunit
MYHRYDIALVRTGSHFGYYAAVQAVYFLRGHTIGQRRTIADDGGGGIVAGRLNG